MNNQSATLPSTLPLGMPPSSQVARSVSPTQLDPLSSASHISPGTSPTSSPTARKFSTSSGYIRSPPLIPPLDSPVGPDSRRSSDSAVSYEDDHHASEEDRPPLTEKRDRRMSREWDAAHTPPSRFQRLPGSIWATPASRDGRVDRNRIRTKGFKEKVKELAGKRRSSE